jgi:hypothetical protein
MISASVPGAAQGPSWIHQFGSDSSDGALATCQDTSRGMYVGGFTYGTVTGQSAGSIDGWLARFDGSGARIWIQQFGTSAPDRIDALAPDGVGGVFAAGYTAGDFAGPNAGSYDLWVSRLDSTGRVLWSRQFGSTEAEGVSSAAPDGRGGVFVAGSTGGDLTGASQAGAPFNAFLLHLDGTGRLSWIRQVSTEATDSAGDLAPDGKGGVFVAGYRTFFAGTQPILRTGAWLARFDSSGDRLWFRLVHPPGGTWIHGLAEDGQGGVFAGGFWTGTPASPAQGGTDAWFGRFDESGNSTWSQSLVGPDADRVYSLVPDGVGGFWAGGRTWGQFLGSHSGLTDVWCARFDPNGALVTAEQFGSTEAELDFAMAPDGSSGAYFVGLTYGDLAAPTFGSSDAWLARFFAP